MLDMDRRIAPVRMLTLGDARDRGARDVPWLGLLDAGPAGRRGARLRRRLAARARAPSAPSTSLFGSWVFSELVIAATILIAGLDSTLLPWLAIPVITLSARFSIRGVIAGVVVAVALCVGVALLSDARPVVDYPPIVIGSAAVIVAVGILSTALMRSDFEHRDEAVIDQLTGMLNRHALDPPRRTSSSSSRS